MIKATVFASQYTSVWRTLTPAMEEFVRRRNMDGYVREWPPIPSTDSAPDRRGIVNEAGFILFSRVAKLNRQDVGSVIQAEMDGAFAAAAAYVTDIDSLTAPAATLAEKREAILISGRLYNFFAPLQRAHVLTVGPLFKGSGIISTCTGDVMLDTEQLWEVKSGDRAYRSVDYRQLAVYTALRYAESGRPFKRIALMNPRRGTWIEVEFEQFAQEIAGQSAVTLCQSLIEAFSVRLASL